MKLTLNMETKIFTHSILAVVLLLSLSCSKSELLESEPSRVIQFTLLGTSTVDLEYLYRDSVIATTNASNGGFNIKTLLSVKDSNTKLQVRKKGSTEIILSKDVMPAPFDQNVAIYYDGTKVYDQTISLLIKGYALTGELEFLLDGNVILSKSGAVDSRSSILIDKGTSREIQIRKKGETAILFSKNITSTEASQTLNFFFDGTNIVDNVKLKSPVNPANMHVSAKFQSIYTTIVYYKPVDVDLVFYERNIATGVATKITPEIRFTLQANGSFNDIELPALTNPKDFVYSCDIVEKGTNNLPYTAAATVAPYVLASFAYQPNAGRLGNPIVFEAGTSKLLTIGDGRFLKTTTPRFTSYGITVTDLTQYFK